MKNHILIATLLLFCGFAAMGQPLNRPTYAMMINTAEEQMEKRDYYRALEWYEKAYDESKDIELVVKIADLSYMLRDYNKAEKWYARALKPTKKNKKVSEYAEKRFEYARSLKMMEKYDEAIAEFDKYIASATDATRKELAELEKVGCEFAKVTKPQDGLSITHGGKEINGKNSEYSPFLSADNKEIYFAALVGDDIIEVADKPKAEDGKSDKAGEDDKAKIDLGLKKEGEGSGGDPFSKIYKSSKSDKGWGKPTVLDENVNRLDFFNVNNSISPDGKRMFFNREIVDGHILKEAKIYLSEGKDGSWGAANELKGVNGNYIAKSPCVGELFGREVLFFVSDMEGGQGGFDIYYATYKGAGQYGDPVNLGPKINSIGNEETPFYRDGVLYFSSDGHPGLGGYDIFMSTWNGTLWSKPANMGKGYNSSVDDLYFMLDKEGYTGVLASNRPSEGSRSVHSKTCCNDIYNVILKKIEANVVATAYDAETKEPLTGVTFEFVEMQGGTPKVLDTKTLDKYENMMELDRNYMIIASAENYSNDTVRLTTLGLFDSKTYTEKLNLKPGRITKKIVRNEPFVLENILYDFNDDKILPPAEGDLQVIFDLMNRYPDMVIELSSHTDARGGDDFNKNLSQRRAESARRWLTAPGKAIPRTRIEAKGYGETQPKTVDAKTNSKFPYLKVGDVLTEAYINALLPDSVKFEAAHQLNRRTEFKILSGPTSITIEEEQLIQIGNRKVDPNAPKVDPKKDPKQTAPNNRKPAPNRNNRNGGNAPGGGDSVKTAPFKLPAEAKKDSIIIDKLSSLYGKKELKGLPVMKFDTRVHDMGQLKKGEVREYTFYFTNVGDTAADIDIVSVCECTSYELGPSLVKPGEKGWVKVIFDSNKKDESGDSDVDIFLKNIDPEFDAPILERVKFKFELAK